MSEFNKDIFSLKEKFKTSGACGFLIEIIGFFFYTYSYPFDDIMIKRMKTARSSNSSNEKKRNN